MVTINGKEVVLADNTSVSDYLEACRYQTNRIVVELNEEILPKDRYAETILKDGDCMEVVTFVGGG
ncbi:MAG: sulfur carrier protein ThiS [Lachnospiraceae bacterium]|nr:sulfur carrier protein ThiS [Lachnospiraceae bacterium]